MPEPAPEPFPIIDVSLDAAETDEAVGSKPKFWYTRRDEVTGEPDRWLFKAVREVHPPKREPDGDDWAECVAAEVAAALGLPHARYELAQWDLPEGLRRGVITRRIQDRASGLTHGNELLAEHAADAGYPLTDPNQKKHFGLIPLYTPELVLEALTERAVGVPASPGFPDAITTGPDLFVGYLLLDALIGNTDRHDENWAVLHEDGRLVLAPTFDHASSLGRELPDSNRHTKLAAQAPPYDVTAYLDRPRSRFHTAEAPTDTRRLSPMESFEAAARVNPTAADVWLARLAAVPLEQLTAPIARVPASRITDLGRRFAERVLAVNRSRLLGDRA